MFFKGFGVPIVFPIYSGRIWAGSGQVLGWFGQVWGRFGQVLGRFWAGFRWIWRGFRAIYYYYTPTAPRVFGHSSFMDHGN